MVREDTRRPLIDSSTALPRYARNMRGNNSSILSPHLTSPLFPETLSSSDMMMAVEDTQEISPILPLSSPPLSLSLSPLGSISSLPSLFTYNSTTQQLPGYNEKDTELLSSVTGHLKSLSMAESLAQEPDAESAALKESDGSMSSAAESRLSKENNNSSRNFNHQNSRSICHDNEEDDFGTVLPPGWSLPDSLFRLSFFLTTEREHILYKLMNTVTIHTINHENICCLNTALMMLIFAQKGTVENMNILNMLFQIISIQLNITVI